MGSRRLTGGWQTPHLEAVEGIRIANADLSAQELLEFLAAISASESVGDPGHIDKVNNVSYFIPQRVDSDGAETLGTSRPTLQEKNYG